MTDKGCSFEGCDRKYEAKGLCKTHYNQMVRGIALVPIGKRGGRLGGSFANIEDFFWARVDKTADCWNWTGAKTVLGYGQIRFQGQPKVLAHRYSYELANGPIQDGGVIDHLCHNASCVNPAHLRLASHTQNMQNRRGAMSNSKSGVRGVWWDHSKGKWLARVTANGKKCTIGSFDKIEDAEVAVKLARLELHS